VTRSSAVVADDFLRGDVESIDECKERLIIIIFADLGTQGVFSCCGCTRCGARRSALGDDLGARRLSMLDQSDAQGLSDRDIHLGG
jgi:hypothetical protein